MDILSMYCQPYRDALASFVWNGEVCQVAERARLSLKEDRAHIKTCETCRDAEFIAKAFEKRERLASLKRGR